MIGEFIRLLCVNGEGCRSVGLYSVFSVFLVEWVWFCTVHSGQRGSSVHMNVGAAPSLLLLSVSFLFILCLNFSFVSELVSALLSSSV